MILDKENCYSDSQVVTGSVASTNVINHGVADGALGPGREMAVFVNLEAVTLDSGNVTVTLNTSNAEAFNTGVVALASRVLVPAEMTVGAKIYIPIPPEYKQLQYTRLNFAAGGNSLTLSAHLIPQDHQATYKAFKSGVEVL